MDYEKEDGTITSITGISLQVDGFKFKNYKKDTYNICFECWLKSLGVEPDKDA
jgi:hypothetical protein